MNAKKVLSKIVEFLSVEEVQFAFAKLEDGTIVESLTFDVGEKLEVVSEDGTKSPAPDGEHKLMLKDSEGEENRMKVITKDGVIVERENVEMEEAEIVKAQPIPAVGNEDKENVMPDLKGQVKEGTAMAEETEEAEMLPEDDEKEDMKKVKAELGKQMEEMAYRIEEMEKKISKMMKDGMDKDEEKMKEKDKEDMKLPKLDGAPVDESMKFAAVEQNKKNFGQKVENYQTSFLSKLYN